MKKNKKSIWIKVIAFCMSLMMAVCGTVTKDKVQVNAATKLKVHFIDVGCGDAILIQYGSGVKAEYGMIDAGPVYYTKTNKKDVNTSNRARNYLKKQKITHLKFVLLTHPHQDHIGGMIKILDDPKIKIDTIYGNNFDLKVLQSSKNKKKQSASTAKLIKYRDDEGIYAQKETIEQLVKKGYNLQAQVLKVPHHGMQDILKNTKKARSDHRYLFQRVKAKIAVISNGYKNSYKAPHKKTLNELKTANVYDTGSRGTIVITSDGKRLSVKVQKGKGPSYKRTKK